MAKTAVAFCVALVLVFGTFAGVVITSLRAIDTARARADIADALLVRLIAESINQEVLFRDVSLQPDSPSALAAYETAAVRRDATAQQLADVELNAPTMERIQASNEAFAAWEVTAAALATRLRTDPQSVTDTERQQETERFAEYGTAGAAIRPEINRYIEDYRERFTRQLRTATWVAGTLTAVGVVFTMLWLRDSSRAARLLEESRSDLAAAYADSSRIAAHLQSAMLGSSTSTNPNADAAARYEPAEIALTVGGDWHDIIDRNASHVVCISGDVVGHGIDAAATMGQLRALLAGLILEGRGPSAALDTLDAYAEHLPDARNATCVVAIIDLERESLLWSRAGHPPPLILAPDGTPRFLVEPGEPPIGVPHEGRRTTAATEFPRGSTLVLYSDGLIERRHEPITVGLDRLAEVASSGAGLAAAELCDFLLGACSDLGPYSDDVAIVACRALDHQARPFSYALPADPNVLTFLRRDLHAWLTDLEVAPLVTQEVILAVDEVVTNSIEHGYRPERPQGHTGIVNVTGTTTDDAIEMLVVDHGTWLAGHGDPLRGRGAAIARACMDEVSVESSAAGTTVSMRRALDREPPIASCDDPEH